jgi:hypothetical protein
VDAKPTAWVTVEPVTASVDGRTELVGVRLPAAFLVFDARCHCLEIGVGAEGEEVARWVAFELDFKDDVFALDIAPQSVGTRRLAARWVPCSVVDGQKVPPARVDSGS